MADMGRKTGGDQPLRGRTNYCLTIEFFERVEKLFDISVDVAGRSALDRAYVAVPVSVHRRDATTTRAANALDDLSKKAKAFLYSYSKVEREFPGILEDVKDHVFDNRRDQILPWISPQKRDLRDDDRWAEAFARVAILGFGSKTKSKNIRKRIPKGKSGPRRHVEVDALIRTAIRVFQDAGGLAAIGGSLEGPFPRFLRELYDWFSPTLNRKIAASADAFVSRAREILHGG